MLANAGVPVGNQAVILAGINDSVPIMKKLMHDLVKSVYVHTTFINVTYLKVSVTSVHQYLKVLKLLKVYVDTHLVMLFRHSLLMRQVEAVKLHFSQTI